MFNKRRVNLGLAILLLGGQVVKSTVAGRRLALLGEQSLKIAEALSAEVLRLKDGLEQQKAQSQEELQQRHVAYEELGRRAQSLEAQLLQKEQQFQAQEARFEAQRQDNLKAWNQVREKERTNTDLNAALESYKTQLAASKQENGELKASNTVQLAEQEATHQRALDEQKQSLERVAEDKIAQLKASHKQSLEDEEKRLSLALKAKKDLEARNVEIWKTAQEKLRRLEAQEKELNSVQQQNTALNEECRRKDIQIEENLERMKLEHIEDEQLLAQLQKRTYGLLDRLPEELRSQMVELSNAQPTIPAVIPGALPERAEVPAAAVVSVVPVVPATATTTTPATGRVRPRHNREASRSAGSSVANPVGGDTNVEFPPLAEGGRQFLAPAQRMAIEAANKRQNSIPTSTPPHNATHLNGNGSPLKDGREQ